MVARRPAPVTSELLGLTQPVISHHVTILVDAGSFAPREALRVAVLLTCPLSLGALAAAAGDPLHFRTWRALVRVQGLTTPEAVTLMARLVKPASAGMGRRGLWLPAVVRPLAPGR